KLYKLNENLDELTSYLIEEFGRDVLVESGFLIPIGDDEFRFCELLSRPNCLFELVDDGRQAGPIRYYNKGALFDTSASLIECTAEKRSTSASIGPELFIVTESFTDAQLLR